MIKSDQFTAFFGVIENVNDPEKLDRVQVRCYGYHTANKAFIPTDLLIWFSTVSDNAGLSGLGSNHSYVQGSTVFGYFVDKELQTGIVIGSLKGVPTRQVAQSMGFSDPDQTYPFYYDESDVNRIARNENIDKTIIKYKKDNVVKDVPKAKGGTWSEKETDYDAVYPNNKVFETRSGHVIEYDDTPGHERITINHRTGSFSEYHPDGSTVNKTNADSFEICLGEKFIFINGNVNQFVSGDVQQNISGELYIKAQKVVIDSDLDVLGVSNATDHISSGVSGANHRHSQNPDSAGHTQQNTNAPLNKGSGFNKTDADVYEIQFDLFDPEIRRT